MTRQSNLLLLSMGSLLGTTLLVAFGILGYVVFTDSAFADAQIGSPSIAVAAE
ncbi:hypothetical protein GCM10007276_05890 [Agaricicola taiwanensis]|uniref:Uncharacterized protein n=1 Tax=Agaricicola taiwanensis TaxID=591372 RepID=A0A8J2YCS4_9RHOB|nr:hypothetical protein [Agaricicola taiwanensis]GGE31529.1 hypothetical protein GCM10007276_05890 [Agaricicola taiwanensis]